MTNMMKYKRQNQGLLEAQRQQPYSPSSASPVLDDNVVKNSKMKRQKIYTEKITINLTLEESQKLEKISAESGVSKTNILRKIIKDSKLFEEE